MEIIWNPQPVPDDEDAVVLTAHHHSQMPNTILGYFHATRQDSSRSVVFTASDFNLPFRDAYAKAKKYAEHHRIPRLYIVDPHGLGAMEIRDR
jgi:hypothetical protein